MKKTQIEKIIDAIELQDKLKDNSITIVKENKKEDWNKEIEESPYNKYYGADIECAVLIMRSVKKGLEAKEAAHISEHRYKVPVARTRDLLHKYLDDSKVICDGFDDVIESQRKGINKKLVYLRRQQYNNTMK